MPSGLSVHSWYRSVGLFFFFQAEDGIRELVRSRGLGDVYKRQGRGGRQRRQHGRGSAVSPLERGAGSAGAAAGGELSLIHI